VITDLNKTPPAKVNADVCIAGTGAAGMALASKLLESNRSVVLLESGGIAYEQAAQALYESEIVGLCLDGANIGRTRQLGGSTNCWGGQLLPLEPLDFEKRYWVKHSGWPLGPGALDPYYTAALRFFEADAGNFDTDVFARCALRDPFDPATMRYYFSKWALQPNLRLRFHEALVQSTNVHLLLHANLTKVHLQGTHDFVAYVECQNDSLRSTRVEAQSFVLCLGGIETARMLLSNHHQIRGGLGNTGGLVGKFFQDHPQVQVGTLIPNDSREVLQLFGSPEIDGRVYSPRFSLARCKQQELSVLNASAYFHFTDHVLLRRRMILNLARQLRAITPISWDVMRQFADLFWLSCRAALMMKKRRKEKAAPCVVHVMTEQEPTEESAIVLSETRDRFGIPRSRINWQLSEQTLRTFQVVAEVAAGELARVGLGRLRLLPYLAKVSKGWSVFPTESFHHMGTTRMALSPQSGVVDANCRVFGIDNLYIASSSVFPTGGHCNPTLTIVALAFRLYEHLFGAE
jgi:choline dehydrogenase-like flavoprotein